MKGPISIKTMGNGFLHIKRNGEIVGHIERVSTSGPEAWKVVVGDKVLHAPNGREARKMALGLFGQARSVRQRRPWLSGYSSVI